MAFIQATILAFLAAAAVAPVKGARLPKPRVRQLHVVTSVQGTRMGRAAFHTNIVAITKQMLYKGEL
jgi:hypothetical protein